MKLGVHLVNFTCPDGPPRSARRWPRSARAAEDAASPTCR